MKPAFPESYQHIATAAYRAAERAWSAFANLLLAHSILSLAWVTIIDGWNP